MAEPFVTDQFSLRWNNFSNNLTNGFMSHLSDKDLVDVTLAVDGQLLQAHKLVLSVCSPYFKDIFKSNPCQHPVIILQDVRRTEVEALLRFMYQGEVNVRQEELATFLKVAEILQIKGLTGESNCENSSVEEENDDFSQNDILKSHYYSDSEDQQNLIKKINFEENKRKNRDTIKKYETVGTKKSRLSIPDLKQVNIPTENFDSIETTKKFDICHEREKNDGEFFHCDKDSKDFRNLDKTYGVSGNNSVDIQNDDTLGIKNEEIKCENEGSNILSEDLSDRVEEPVTYRLSARGRPQLVHEGYVYNLTSRSEVLNRSHYRCAEQHRGCRGKCAVIAECFMPTGIHEHNHSPGYQSENAYKKKKNHDSDQV